MIGYSGKQIHSADKIFLALLLAIVFFLAGNPIVLAAPDPTSNSAADDSTAGTSTAAKPTSNSAADDSAAGTSTAAKPTSNSAADDSAASASAIDKTSTATPDLQMFAVQDSKLNVAQEILPNGLKIIVLEDHSFPTVSCLMWYHVGSKNEAPGLSGMSHLVEHMVFKSAGMRKPGDIPFILSRIGADFNGYTSQDFTAYFETMPATRLELALRIEAARMCKGKFTQAAVTEELKRIASEPETKKSDLQNTLACAVHAAAYQAHLYRIPTCGWATDIKNLNARSAQAFYNHYYVPDNATLVMVGNVTAKNAMKLAEQYFSVVPRSTTQGDCTISEPPQTGSHIVNVKAAGNHQILQLAYHAPAVSDPDAAAMAVIESLLNARSFRPALVQNKICSSVSSAFELKHDPGLFVITCDGVSGGNRQKTIEAIDEAVASLRHQPINEQDLKRARNSAEFSFLCKRNSPYKLGFDLGYFDAVSDWRAAFSWPRQLQAVSGDDVQRVARKYFDTDTRVVGWAGLPDAAAAGKTAASAAASKTVTGAGTTSKGKKETAEVKPQNKSKNKGHNKAQSSKVQSKGEKATRTSERKKRSAGNGGAPSGREQQQKLRQALLSERVPVLCYQPDSSPDPPPMNSSTSGNKPGVLNGSASKIDFSTPAAAKYASSIANKLSAIQSRSLSNGLRLVVFESHLSPVVQIVGAIEAGQVFDSPGKKGLSELAAASFNAGSISYAKGKLVHVQEDRGISPDAMLHFDSGLQTITFHNACLSRDLKAQLELLGNIISPTVFADMDINRFKADALSALKQKEDSTSARVNRTLLQNLLSSNSPYYPVPPFEKTKTINNLQAADLKAFHDKYIVPGAAVIVIAGDTTLDEAARILEKTLSNWPAKSTVSKAPPVELSLRHILRTSIPLKQDGHSVVCLGQLLQFGVTSPEYVNLLAAGCALTEHPVLSRLGLDLNEEEPVLANALNNGDISSCVNPLGDYVAWSLSLSVQPDVVSRTVRALLREARRLSRGGLTPIEVAEIKRYLAGALPVRHVADVSMVSRNILDSTLQSNWPDFYQPLLTSVYSLSPDSLNKFLHSSFKPDQSTIVVAAEPHTIRALRQQALSSAADK